MLILDLTSFEIIARFPVKYSEGRLLVINSALYGYLGLELILVNGVNLQSFGALEYDSENILKGREVEEVNYLSDMPDGGMLISIVTSTHEAILIVLYQDRWKLFHRSSGIGAVFSLQTIGDPRCFLVVTSTHQSEVIFLER